MLTLSLFFGQSAWSQESLQILDEEGTALESVLVYLEDQTIIGLSDQNGWLDLSAWDGHGSLYFQYLGYQELVLSSKQLTHLNYQVKLDPALNAILGVEVIGSRDERPDQLSFQTQRIDENEIALLQSASTVDALAANGVFVQKSQLGGGSPNLRGFEANRVLLVIDGVRMNNAIYRSGHLQNAITVDEGSLAAAELIFGPGSLTYGSDALGGVIHFRTKQLPFLRTDAKQTSEWNLHYLARYASASQENSYNLRAEGHGHKWTSLTSFSYSDFGDLRTGANYPNGSPRYWDRLNYVETGVDEDQIVSNTSPLIQSPSGYQQYDFLQKFNWQLDSKLILKANLQYSSSSDIPRYDRLTEERNGQLRFAEWYYGPQTRWLASLRADLSLQNAWADRASLILSYQFIEEDRHDRQLFNPIGESSLVNVAVYGLTLDLQKSIDPYQRHQLLYGLEWRSNQVYSRAFLRNFREDLIDGPSNSRYPSMGSDLSSYGAYLQYRWTKRDSSLMAEAGLRYSQQSLFGQFGTNDPIAWPQSFINGITNRSNALTWASGINWRLGQYQVRLLAATAFRAPNVDDFAKFREKNGFVQIPNTSIAPERSFSLEAGVSRSLGSNWKLGLNAFWTRLNDVMVREDFPLPNGQFFFINRGDSLFTQANVNAEQARVWGLSTRLSGRWAKCWRLEGSLTYTQGKRDFRVENGSSVETPLSHIPPLYGRLGLTYQYQDWTFKGLWIWQGAKEVKDYAVTSISEENGQLIFNREGSSDNIEQARIDPETGAFLGLAAWSSFNLFMNYELSTKLQVQLSLENIFDRHYRVFASGISAPGRNLILGVRGCL